MKKLLVIFILLCSSVFAELPPFPADTLDEVIAAMNKDGFGSIAVSNILDATSAAYASGEENHSEFKLILYKESANEAAIEVAADERAGHPCVYNKAALLKKMAELNLIEKKEGRWIGTNGNVRITVQFREINGGMWGEQVYTGVNINYLYNATPVLDTIRLWD